MIIVLLKQDESHFFFADPYIFHWPHEAELLFPRKRSFLRLIFLRLFFLIRAEGLHTVAGEHPLGVK